MNDHKLTEIDMLIPEDQRRLAAATSNVIVPLPAGNIEECFELLGKQSRKISVEEHQRFREALAGPAPAPDELDELLEELRHAQPQHRIRK